MGNVATEYADTLAYATSMNSIAQASQAWGQQLSTTLEHERAMHRQEVADMTRRFEEMRATLTTTTRERDEAVTALQQADVSFRELSSPVTSGDPFAVFHVARLRSAFLECRSLRGTPEATQPQGFIDPGLLVLAEIGGCCLCIRPMPATGDRASLSWRRMRYGLHEQLVRMHNHLDQVSEAAYRERPPIPELAEFICCLMTKDDQMRVPLPKPDTARSIGAPP
jgi:hypothetical protein